MSRQHLRIAREGGVIVVRDLGSRNGTQLRGLNLVGAIPVGDGLELTPGQGGAPPPLAVVGLRRRGDHRARAASVRRAPRTARASRGSRGSCATGSDAWIELVTEGRDAYIGEMSLVPTVTLLVGDVLACERGGAEVLRVVGE